MGGTTHRGEEVSLQYFLWVFFFFLFKMQARKRSADLDGSVQLGGLDAKIDEADDGQADEEPVVEAEIVDQAKDVRHGEIQQRHDALR